MRYLLEDADVSKRVFGGIQGTQTRVSVCRPSVITALSVALVDNLASCKAEDWTVLKESSKNQAFPFPSFHINRVALL